MQTSESCVQVLDLEYLGCSQVIATYLLQSESDVALVDPGPTCALPVLRAKLARHGLRVGDLRTILLTHIHLDHAGSTGTLVRENPRIRVLVHERGANHLIDPARLLRSAERIYGDQMDRLWGEFLAVPATNILPLAGGERVSVGRLEFDVLYTPGHASHHVSYLGDSHGLAFVGDVAGIRIAGHRVVPVTPAPDIDLEAWNQSLDQISARRPTALFLTHFGVSREVERHIWELRRMLTDWSASVFKSLGTVEIDEPLASAFGEEIMDQFRRCLPQSCVAAYRLAVAPEFAWYGLARYWRRRLESAGRNGGS